MGSTEMTTAAQELLFPSVTLCRESFLHKTGRSANMTEDYDKLPRLDKMLRLLTQAVTIKNK